MTLFNGQPFFLLNVVLKNDLFYWFYLSQEEFYSHRKSIKRKAQFYSIVFPFFSSKTKSHFIQHVGSVRTSP